jgi:hypothetical protein
MRSACVRHCDREGAFYCQKDDLYMCRECARCQNPRLYCKLRTSCVIDLLTKEGELQVEQTVAQDVEHAEPPETGTGCPTR